MRGATWREAAVVVVIALGLYVSAGTLGAYLARDDFQWLNDARDLGVRRAFVLSGRSHFYRPVVEVWWVGATHLCGAATGCYHALELSLHVANGVLLLFLTSRVFGRRDLALASAAIFVVMPSYVEAVVWVCAVTTAFAATWYFLALHFGLTAARTRRVGASVACLGCAAAAMYSHEATATLFAAVPLVVWQARVARRPKPWEAVSCALLGVGFVATTIVANHRNYVFAEGHYAPGTHAISHALRYVRSIYVGSNDFVEMALVATLAVLIALRGNRAMRAGLLWMAVTMPPFLWFTWGNVGRYTYLPSAGFTWIVAGAIIAVRDAADRRVVSRPWIGPAVAVVLVMLVAGRFAAFAHRAIRSEVRWMAAYRAYGDAMANRIVPGTLEVTLPAPQDPAVEDAYVAPMMEWRTSQPGLRVILERPPGGASFD